MIKLLVFFIFAFPLIALSNDEEIKLLKVKVKELEEIQSELSVLLKRQILDVHQDQVSPGYLEIKSGLSLFNPKELEDENDELFSGQDDAEWKDFGNGNLFDIEIGKIIDSGKGFSHQIGIGYQFFKSSTDGKFKINSDSLSFTETVSSHIVFLRYTMLHTFFGNKNISMGPGFTLGYSPASKLDIEIEKDNEGAKISAESTSMLIELFLKTRIQFSRYFSFVLNGGYRIQEANDLKLTAAELVSVKTNTDLDFSGLYTTAGLAVNF